MHPQIFVPRPPQEFLKVPRPAYQSIPPRRAQGPECFKNKNTHSYQMFNSNRVTVHGSDIYGQKPVIEFSESMSSKSCGSQNSSCFCLDVSLIARTNIGQNIASVLTSPVGLVGSPWDFRC